DLDYRIVGRARQGLELTPHPFEPIARDVGIPQDQLLDRLRVLRRLHVVNFLGPIYFAEAFGRGLSLATVSVPAASCEQVAREIGRFPNVVHLSTTLHRFNIWFTVKANGVAAKEQVL